MLRAHGVRGRRLFAWGLAVLGSALVMMAPPAVGSETTPPADPAAPVFTKPTCGSVIGIPAVLNFGLKTDVAATDADPKQVVTIDAEDLPSWASFAGTSGNPATGAITGNPDIFLWAQGVLADLFTSIGAPIPGLPSATAEVTLTATDDEATPRVTECPLTLRIVVAPGSPV